MHNIMSDSANSIPCGACRELMVQLMPEKYKGIEIMMDYKQEKIMALGELTPEWWIWQNEKSGFVEREKNRTTSSFSTCFRKQAFWICFRKQANSSICS